jgi:FixJ family two-component response regulator
MEFETTSGLAANADPFTVFLIDNDRSALDGVSRLLHSVGHSTKTYVQPKAFLDEHDRSAHGCVVLELSMPGLNGLDVQKELLKRGVERPVIFLTKRATIETSVEAMKAGAIDFLPKPFKDDELLGAISIAVERDRARLKKQAERDAAASRLATLRPREREVIDLVVRGMANKNIAATLGISLRTVKEHRGRACQKMRARHVAELVRMMGKVAGPQRMAH